ncbi:MAG: thiamine pyrophosphate-binding protein [Deltaproteobacteria bacterium]|nr:thiamine pyrophosphate-binding protein [Deltaproteobacteria bacterium]
MSKTGAEAILNRLQTWGVETVFGIPSIHNLPLYEALRKTPAIRHILCRQETMAAHMADGYARAGHRLGVVITSTGPGTGYVLPAVQEAWGSSSPMLIITTNIPGNKIEKGTGALHELDHQHRLFDAVTKERFAVRSPEELVSSVHASIRTVFSGRPGPVYLEIPTDLLRKPAPDRVEDTPRTERVSGDMENALSLLETARQPLVIAGTDAVRARLSDDITALAETLGAPVITSIGGKGIVPEDQWLSFGNGARRGVVRDVVDACDVALAVGTRLRDVDLKRRGLKLPRLIHMDWDERWVQRNFPAEVVLTGDITRHLEALLTRLVPAPSLKARQDWLRDRKARYETERRAISEARRELHYLNGIRRVLPRDSVLVADNTLLGYWAEYFYPALHPGSFMGAKGSSIIGFSLAGAMGAKLACPEIPVVALIGDGGFLYGAQELATCVRHGIAVTVIVVNDHRFGIIGHLQKTYYGGIPRMRSSQSGFYRPRPVFRS